jgi:hypothetical protein
MGGRRAAHLGNLVGNSKIVAPAKRQLSAAIAEHSPEAIANASVRLVATSSVGLRALRYGLKLTPYIAEQGAALARLSPAERTEAIRAAWGSLKAREGIRGSLELDAAVISAASAAFRKK